MRWLPLLVALALLAFAPGAYAAAPTAAPDTLTFAQDVQGGPSAPKTSVITNSTGGSVSIQSISAPTTHGFQLMTGGPADCSQSMTLPDGKTCDIRVEFDPALVGPASDTVVVSTDAGSVSVNLVGSGNGSLNFFNDVNAGPSAPQKVTVTNSGDVQVTLGPVINSNPADFSQVDGDCVQGRVLGVGDSCSMSVVFDPSTTGGKTGTITVNSDVAPPISVDLSGLATEDPLGLFGTLSLGTLDVGSGTTLVKAATLRNMTLHPITLTKIRLLDPDAGRFLWARGLTGDCAIGQTLGADKGCGVRIVFVPQSAGLRSATLVVTSTAGVSGLTLKATGKPGLRIPMFGPTAASSTKRRLAVPVRPLGGTVRKIVVTIRSQSGKVLGRGTLSSASDETDVNVKLKSALKRGTYVVKATGRDSASHAISAPALTFDVR